MTARGGRRAGPEAELPPEQAAAQLAASASASERGGAGADHGVLLFCPENGRARAALSPEIWPRRPSRPYDRAMRIVRERRQRRSDNTTLALHYQLEACRQAARLDGLVLSDEDGFCLAASGDPQACHEVAARLPFIGRKVREFEGVLLGTEGGWRIRMQRFGVAGRRALPVRHRRRRRGARPELARSRGAVRRILEPRAEGAA